MVLYAVATNSSIGELFVAGLFRALLTVMLGTDLVPGQTENYPRMEKAASPTCMRSA